MALTGDISSSSCLSLLLMEPVPHCPCDPEQNSVQNPESLYLSTICRKVLHTIANKGDGDSSAV